MILVVQSFEYYLKVIASTEVCQELVCFFSA